MLRLLFRIHKAKRSEEGRVRESWKIGKLLAAGRLAVERTVTVWPQQEATVSKIQSQTKLNCCTFNAIVTAFTNGSNPILCHLRSADIILKGINSITYIHFQHIAIEVLREHRGFCFEVSSQQAASTNHFVLKCNLESTRASAKCYGRTVCDSGTDCWSLSKILDQDLGSVNLTNVCSSG